MVKLKQKQLRQLNEDKKPSKFILFFKTLFSRKTDIADCSTSDD